MSEKLKSKLISLFTFLVVIILIIIMLNKLDKNGDIDIKKAYDAVFNNTEIKTNNTDNNDTLSWENLFNFDNVTIKYVNENNNEILYYFYDSVFYKYENSSYIENEKTNLEFDLSLYSEYFMYDSDNSYYYANIIKRENNEYKEKIIINITGNKISNIQITKYLDTKNEVIVNYYFYNYNETNIN